MLSRQRCTAKNDKQNRLREIASLPILVVHCHYLHRYTGYVIEINYCILHLVHIINDPCRILYLAVIRWTCIHFLRLIIAHGKKHDTKEQADSTAKYTEKLT